MAFSMAMYVFIAISSGLQMNDHFIFREVRPILHLNEKQCLSIYVMLRICRPGVILPVCLKSLYFNHFVRRRGFYTSPAASLCSNDFVRSQMAFNMAICGYILNSSGLWVNEQVLFCEVGPGLHQNENNAFVCVLSICSLERHRTYFASNVCISTIL